MERIVILGAGFGGLAVAEGLDPLMGTGKVDVTLVDRNPAFNMGFSMHWVLVGRRRPEEGERRYASLATRNVRFVLDEVSGIDTTDRIVHLKSRPLPYDRLVLALGAELVPETVPGLAEGAYNLCSLASVIQLKAAVEAIDHGTVLLAVSSLPFKCPPSPYEYAFLIDDILRTREVRKDVKVVLSTPEERPMAVAGKAVGEQVVGMLKEREIEYYPGHRPKSVDVKQRRVRYENGVDLDYRVLGAVPPQRAPKLLRLAGLADASGFVPVDLATMETSLPHVYAIGDAASITLPNGSPHPKAGVFAEVQGIALARRLASELGGAPSAEYEGKGTCYVDVGGDRAAPAKLELLAKGGPKGELEAPSAEGLSLKRQYEKDRFRRWFGE